MSTRRKFLQLMGLSAGATLLRTDVLARFTTEQEILKLTPDQQVFMASYGEWMDEFIVVIAEQKAKPGDQANHQKMMALTERAEAFRPQLTEYMKDETFAVIYKLSIERMRKEIV